MSEPERQRAKVEVHAMRSSVNGLRRRLDQIDPARHPASHASIAQRLDDAEARLAQWEALVASPTAVAEEWRPRLVLLRGEEEQERLEAREARRASLHWLLLALWNVPDDPGCAAAAQRIREAIRHELKQLREM